MTRLIAAPPDSSRRRVLHYLLCAALAGLAMILVLGLHPVAGATFQDIFETMTVVLPLVAGIMAIVRYASDGERGFLVLGAGLVIVSVLDAAHLAVSHVSVSTMLGLEQPSLRVWSWFSSRLFLALLLSWLLWARDEKKALASACVLGLVALVAPMLLPLPAPTEGNILLQRPVEVLASAGFARAMWVVARDGRWRTEPFHHAVMLALVVNLATDFAAGMSTNMEDSWIIIAHGLKAASYGLVLAGLMASMHLAYRFIQSARDNAIADQAALRAHEDVLNARLSELEEAHEALEKQGSMLAEMAEDLTVARAKSELADRAKSEHLATVSHEIRTPLNGVLGMAQLLRETSLDDLQQRYVETIISSGKAQLGILNDVLDLSKITAKKLEMTVEPFDPRAAAESVVELMAGSKQSDDVDLCVLTDPSLPRRICGDEARFRQIVLNLVGNALKFTEHGGINVSLQAKASTDGDGLELLCQVQDTGVGINKDDQHRLFGEFVQADTSAQRLRGTGLGLSICKKLCELMGGSIGLDSTPGKGSCFWFCIRVQPVADAVAEPAAASLPSLAGKTALLTLDNPVSADALRHYLERCGATICDDRGVGVEAAADLTFVDLAAWQRGGHMTGTLVLVAMNREDVSQGDGSRVRGRVRQPVSESTVAEGLNALLSGGGETTDVIEVDDTTSAGDGEKILVVDDNAVNLELVRVVLARSGFDVTAARDGAAGIDACAETEFDFILMDLQMPRMDGYEATRHIRGASDWGAVVPIVALTASPMSEAQPRCVAAGMNDCIAKPFKLAALLSLITELIDAGRQAAQTKASG